MEPKVLVLFSGGLDSRLAIKLLQDKNVELEALFFKLPFGGGCCNDFECVFNYSQIQGVKLHVIDLTKQPLLEEYLNIVLHPKYGYGSSLNPCKDCKIFMFKKAKELMEKIGFNLLATGEVLDQRPNSQKKKDFDIIEKETDMKDLIIRPLCEIGIHGRQRKKQIELAKRFNIKYPGSGGGCTLCEKGYSLKLKDLLKHKPLNKITHEDILTLKGGRHFRNNGKIILGKNESQNNELILLNKVLKYNIIIPENPGPTILYEKSEDKSLAEELQKAYSSKDQKNTKLFEKYRIN